MYVKRGNGHWKKTFPLVVKRRYRFVSTLHIMPFAVPKSNQPKNCTGKWTKSFPREAKRRCGIIETYIFTTFCDPKTEATHVF